LCTCRHGKLQGLALNSPHHHMQVDTSAVDPTGGHGSSIPSPAHSMPATCMANRCLRGQHEWPNTTCKSTHLLWTRPVDMARQSHRLHTPCQRHAWPTAAFVDNMSGPTPHASRHICCGPDRWTWLVNLIACTFHANDMHGQPLPSWRT